MATSKKVKGTAISMPAGVVLGVFVSLLITGILAGVLTWLALDGKIGEKTLGYFVMGTLLIASGLGSLLSAVKIKRRWMLVCGITGVAYYLMLLACTAIFFGGNYRGVGVTGLLVLIGSLISGVLGLKKNGHGEKRYRKYNTR